MRMRVLFILVMYVASTAPLFAEKERLDSAKTDGDYWGSLNAKERRQLLHGMFIGTWIASRYGDMSTETASKLSIRMSLDDAVKSFDAFYREPLNRPIGFEEVWFIHAARANDVPEETITKLIGDLRATLAGKAPPLTEPLPTKHPEVYDIALNFADRSKVLRELFGDDIEYANERANAWALGPDQGEAYVFIDTASSKATGRMSGHAKRIGGKWVYDDLQVLVIGTGEIIDLLKDSKE